MKKLLFILSAVFVSVMGLAQATMNPYAYDLQSTWNEETRKLTLSFKTNTKPNLNPIGKSYGPEGIMVKLVSLDGTKTYKAIPVMREDITGCGPYQYVIDFSTYQNSYGNNTFDGIPGGEWFTWQVDVAGQSNDQSNYPYGRTKPTVTCWNAAYRPVGTHGVAVSKGYNSTDFGRIYATVFNDNSETIIQNTYTWLKNKTPSVINYEPMYLTIAENIPTTYTASGFKSSYDPHRVRVSDDGRMFVSSQWSGDNRSAVWECTNGVYKGIITRTSSNGRIVAMDVRGAGENLTMLLCEVKTNAGTYSSGQTHAQLIIREYEIGKLGSDQRFTIEDGTPVAYYNDFRTSAGYQGLIHQAYTGSGWYLQKEGLINVAYGSGNAIWLKVDFFLDTSTGSRIVYYDGTNNGMNYKDDQGNAGTPAPPSGIYVNKMPHYGGDGLLINGNTLITGTVDCIRFYTINNNGSLTEQTGNRISTIKDSFRGTAEWVTDLAIDPANNVYAVSSDAMNLMVISLPYSGLTTTKVPDRYKFKVPYPASDLQYAPVEGKNQYKFTFKVDATPRTVDVRFYTTKEQMLKGGDDYAFHYSEFTTIGKFNMSVTFDAVKGTITNKELNDPDGNGVLNLPPGEYYWCVCVNGTATPSSDNYCYIPERLSQDLYAHEMNQIKENPQDIAIWRPMQKDCYNTLCLPFNVNINELADSHPYKKGELLKFSGVNNISIAGENILELLFEETTIVEANKPYLYKPKENITSIQSLGVPIVFEELVDIANPKYQTDTYYFVDNEGENSIKFWSLIPRVDGISATDGEVLLILVADNRLAKMSSGPMLGLRAFFYLQRQPAGTVMNIAERQSTTTSVVNLNGEQVDVNKFLQEGRVYIRVGEALYTLDGQKVE